LKRYIGVLFLLWTGALNALFYVVQKPGLLELVAQTPDKIYSIYKIP